MVFTSIFFWGVFVSLTRNKARAMKKINTKQNIRISTAALPPFPLWQALKRIYSCSRHHFNTTQEYLEQKKIAWGMCVIGYVEFGINNISTVFLVP